MELRRKLGLYVTMKVAVVKLAILLRNRNYNGVNMPLCICLSSIRAQREPKYDMFCKMSPQEEEQKRIGTYIFSP